MTSKKGAFYKNRFSFYLLAIGSACGLGNLWRFPYVVGEHGGGAFLLLYVFLALTVGLSLLIAELMIGRQLGVGVLVASKTVAKNRRHIAAIGWFSLCITVVTLAYYSVISGWVLHYLTQFIMSLFQPDPVYYLKNISVNVLLKNGWLQFLLASVHLLVVAAVILKDFGDNVEKRISSLLPLFGLLVIFLLVGSLSLDSKQQVLRFLFYPDFSKLNLSSLGHALGHVFFTLSLGFGTMVTFGSYLHREDHLPTIGLRVTLVDTAISVLSVLLIFPIAFSSSKTTVADPSLLFEVLPEFLSSMKGGILFGFAFFLFLWLAAVNASISLLETITANLIEKRPDIKRSYAVSLVAICILLLTVFPAFSETLFKNVNLLGRSLIEFFDVTLVNVFLPIAVLGLLYLFFKNFSESERKKIFVAPEKPTSLAMYPQWIFLLKWFTPVLVVSGLLMLALAALMRT